MSKSNELEHLDGGLPHCCDNPADKLDSKMTEREQFEKKRIKELGEMNYKSYYQSVILWHSDYEKYLEKKLTTLREDITAEAIMLIKEYALCPDEKLTGDAIRLKRKIVEAMGGDKLSKVREWVEIKCRSCDYKVECKRRNDGWCCNMRIKELKQILEGK